MLLLTFFNPLLLWALPLAAVPIIIHLLNRRRFNRVPWAAMEYLLRAMKRNRRRMQMEHWIVLLLRTLAVIALIFLVTRPQLGGGGGILKARTHHVVMVDDSASMAQRFGATNLFKAADAELGKLVRGLIENNSGDMFTLMLSSDGMGQPQLFAQSVNAELERKVRDKLMGRNAGDAGVDLRTLLTAARKHAEEKKKDAGDFHYHLLTDSRVTDILPSGKPNPALVKHLQEMDPNHAQFSVKLLGNKETDNLGITAVRRRDRLAMVGAVTTLEVEVTNFGDSQSQIAEVSVAVDGQSRVPIQVPAIPAGGKVVVDKQHTFREPGFHSVVANLTRDKYPVDDLGVLALEVAATSQVLVVNGDPSDSLEDSETFYLSAALDTGGDLLSGITVTETSPDGLSAHNLDDYNMVWLANVPPPREDVVAALERFVAGGGGLVIFLGGNQLTSPEKFNDVFYKDGKGLLPLAVTERKGDMEDPDPVHVTDNGHYSMRSSPEFFELVLANAVLVGRYWGMADDPTRPVSVPLRVRNATGAPFMVSSTYQQGGEVLAFATTADIDWSNFAASRVFLVMCQEIHRHATKAQSLAAYNLQSNSTFKLDIDPAMYRRDVFLQAAGGQSFEETYSALDQEPAADGSVRATVSIPMASVQGLGLFKLTLTPHRGNPEERLIARAAPAAEGRLQRLGEQGWAREFKGMDDRLDVVEVNKDGSASAAGQVGGEGELWRLLALALLGMLMLETLLAWRFGRR